MSSPTLAQLDDPDLDVAFYVRIEGIGAISGSPETSRAAYAFTRLPDWTPTATQRFVTGLHVPSPFSQSADLLGGIADAGGLSFEVTDFLDTDGTRFWSQMFATERWSTSPGTFPTTYLRLELDPAAGTAFVDSVDGFNVAGGRIWIGSELIGYTATASDVPGGGPRFTGLTRGLHPAAGVNFGHLHRVVLDSDGARVDLPTLVTTRPVTWFGRMFSLYAVHRLPSGPWETEANAELLYTGFIRHVDWDARRNRYRFRCDPVTEALKRKVFSRLRAEQPMVGLNLGSDPEMRQLRIYSASLSFVLGVAQWHESVGELVNAINAAIGASAISEDIQPWIDTGVRDDGSRWVRWSGSSTLPFIDLKPGLAGALGWSPSVGIERIDVGVSPLDPSSAARFAPHAPPSVYYYESAAVSDDDATRLPRIYVQDATGFITNQGGEPTGFNASYVLIGNRWLFRVTSINTAVTPHELRGETANIHPYYFSRYGALDHLLARDGEGDAGGEEETRRAPAIVRQVFPALGNTGANVITALLRAMHSTGRNATTGNPSYNGTHDVYASGLGCAIPAAVIDADSFTAFRDEHPSIGTWRGVMFDEPASLWDWLQQEARTQGFQVVVDRGRIALRPMEAVGLAVESVRSVTRSDMAPRDDRPGWSEGPPTVLNLLTMAWDKQRGESGGQGEFRQRHTLLQDLGSSDTFQTTRALAIENDYLLGAPTDEHIAAIAARAASWVGLLRRPVPIVRFRTARRLWQRLVPLDVFTLADPSLPDRGTGLIGVTAKLCIAKSVGLDPHGGGTVECLMLPMQRQAPLMPSALLDFGRPDGGWDSVNRRLYCLPNEFSAPAATVDVSHFRANYRILVCEDAPADPTAPQLWRVTVAPAGPDIVAGFIPTVEDLPGFVATRRYYVTFDTYDVVLAAQRAEATFIADADDSRILATTDWYPYA